MKKNYYTTLSFRKLKKSVALFMLSAGMSFNSIAQPVLVSTNLQPGISFNVYSLSGVNNSAVMALNGSNVTWNLSAANLGAQVATIDYLTVAATGYASAYPSANYAMKLTAGGNFKYDLSVVTSTVLEDTAINVGTSGLQTFVNNRTQLAFPFTYGLTLTDTYQKSGQSATTVTHNYDAYGTLIVGTDTLHNLVRDMSTDNGVSTTSATWWNVSPLYPVLQVSSSGATYLKSSAVTGINTLSEKEYKQNIYPNPNNGSFVIEPNNETKLTMQVYDVNGKLVLTQTINGKTIVDASSLNEGVYNISLQSNEGVVNKRIVIIK